MSEDHPAQAGKAPDRRVRKSRVAIQAAFSSLFIERGFDGFGVGDVIARADIARSTFYQHFSGKEEVLGVVMGPVLAPLAMAGKGGVTPPQLALMLNHLWSNRTLARELFVGSARAIVIRLLCDLIEAQCADKDQDAQRLPPRLRSSLLANAQIGVVEEWLTGKHRCSPEELAAAVSAACAAADGALRHPAPPGAPGSECFTARSPAY